MPQLPKEIKTTVSNNTSFLKIVEICLVHLRGDRREEKMSMPHAAALYNAIQYQRQTLDYFHPIWQDKCSPSLLLIVL